MNTELLISMESMNEVDLTKAITEIVANTIGVESVGVNPVQDFFGTYGMESAYEPTGKLALVWRKLKKFSRLTTYGKLKSEINYISKLNPELVKDEETEVKVNLDDLKEASKLLGNIDKYDTKNLSKELLEEAKTLLDKINEETKTTTPTKVGDMAKRVSRLMIGLNVLRASFEAGVWSDALSNVKPVVSTIKTTISSIIVFSGLALVNRIIIDLLVYIWLKSFKKKLTEEKLTDYAKEFDERIGSKLKELTTNLRKATGVNVEVNSSEFEKETFIKALDKSDEVKKIDKDEKVKIVNLLKEIDIEEVNKTLDTLKPRDISKVYSIIGKISKDLTSMGDTESVDKIKELISLLEVKKLVAVSTLLQVLEDAKKY